MNTIMMIKILHQLFKLGSKHESADWVGLRIYESFKTILLASVAWT